MLNLTSGIFATLYMTGTSYILSRIFNKNFREPELLQALLFKTYSGLSINIQILISWLLHIAIGCILAAVINSVWHYKLWLPTWSNAILLGLCSGVAGVVVWGISFYLRKNQTSDLLPFYTQLVAVHVLFGIVVMAVYKLSL